MTETPILVKVVHAYTPVNNDELRLEKGDILTIARKEEGGWWEGTLANGKTGWFPSNYVEDVTISSRDSGGSSTAASVVSSSGITPAAVRGAGSNGLVGAAINKLTQSQSQGDCNAALHNTAAFAAQQAEYRQVALNELIDSESVHISELQTFWDSFLVPLQKSDLLTPAEFKVMVGEMLELIQVQRNNLLLPLQAENKKHQKEQRIGSLFLESAPKIEQVLKTYCNNHPKAVQVVERHKEELGTYFETNGCSKKPGILFLITSLSQPFRRLEKYPLLLQEVERHVEEFHIDRGDLQRSIEYYKTIQATCGALRKQKEMELEVLSGAIKGWEGAEVSQLGEIIFMNLVYIGLDKQPRYFVLFPNTLLILSYSTDSNSLVYDGKVPVSGITVKQLPDKDGLVYAFEVAGPMIEHILVSCSSKSFRDTWINHLNSILKSTRFPSFCSSPQQSFGELTPPVQAWNISRLRPAPPFNPFLYEYLKNKTQHVKQLTSPQKYENGSPSIGHAGSTPSSMKNGSSSNGRAGGTSSTSSLASIGGLSLSYNLNNCSSPVQPVTNEDDFAVLSIVDSFCNKNRLTAPPSVPESRNKPSAVQPQPPKTLAQIVLQLRDEVISLKKSVEDEQSKRLALQLFVQKSINGGANTNGSSSPSPVLSGSTPPEQ